MLTRNPYSICAALVLAALVVSAPVQAHEGHDDTTALTGEAAPAGAPLSLSSETIANLDVKTATAAS